MGKTKQLMDAEVVGWRWVHVDDDDGLMYIKVRGWVRFLWVFRRYVHFTFIGHNDAWRYANGGEPVPETGCNWLKDKYDVLKWED